MTDDTKLKGSDKIQIHRKVGEEIVAYLEEAEDRGGLGEGTLWAFQNLRTASRYLACPGCGWPSSWAPDLCPECLDRMT